MASKNLKILGIDTSCDDTCISLLKIENCKLEILSNVISSQVKLHRKYGGVYPFLAKREHHRNLPLVFKKATKNIEISQIDSIGVTIGPGLEPCLWQGINFAIEMAKKFNLKIVPVNHIEAHILANFLPKVSSNFQFSIFNFQKIFPAICLVVSGGHTQLILMRDIGKYKLIGETRDDAAGECFDKTARILGLGYPGGPAIAKMAKQFKIQNSKFKISLPRPMIYQKNYDFSFSGLKTAVLYLYQKSKFSPPQIFKENLGGQENQKFKQALAFEIQQAIIDVLIKKTIKAAKDYKAKSIILGGGVAANDELRRQFKDRIKKDLSNIQYLIPDIQFCTDNAAMVAITAYFHLDRAKPIGSRPSIKADANQQLGE